MSARSNHLFQFRADDIAKAAQIEAEYHEKRSKYWKAELDKSTKLVEETASVKVTKQAVTGGWRPDVVVNYGDPSAYTRMTESWSKLNRHEESAQRFRSDEQVYATQAGRIYELDTDDVHHFRLNGVPRNED